MSKNDKKSWQGLSEKARASLVTRDYSAQTFSQLLADVGIEAGQLAAADRSKKEVSEAWIPGVEIFSRKIHPQRYRGSFGEFVRRDEGILAQIGFWPQQWSAARMFAQTAKGFHVHPPSVPENESPGNWLRRLFIEEPQNYSLRRYDHEQWDVMFFVQGVAEMILRDAREGLPAHTMRFFVDGDNHRSPNNIGIVVPPGVAHAIRAEGSEDVIMVYGTSTTFHAEFEGRIASEIETASLPESWQKFLGRGD
jgi:dTDP-4-dehydrorhamnose 3,5-epimerase-like enzyme